MTDTVVSARKVVRSESKFFYFQMALVCMAVAFLGFLPSYWAPMAAGTLTKAPISHIHGIIFFCWSLYIVFQSWLGATGQIVRHRAVGLIGVSLATAMLIFGVMVTIQVLRETAAAGRAAMGVEIADVALSNVLLFAGLIIFALINTRRPEWHKRLMLMAAISILGAPIARWLMVYLHMPPPAPLSDWLVCLLASVPMLQDWRMRGRPHNAYWVAFAAIVVVRLLRIPFGETQVWHDTARWLLRLAG